MLQEYPFATGDPVREFLEAEDEHRVKELETVREINERRGAIAVSVHQQYDPRELLGTAPAVQTPAPATPLSLSQMVAQGRSQRDVDDFMTGCGGLGYVLEEIAAGNLLSKFAMVHKLPVLKVRLWFDQQLAAAGSAGREVYDKALSMCAETLRVSADVLLSSHQPGTLDAVDAGMLKALSAQRSKDAEQIAPQQWQKGGSYSDGSHKIAPDPNALNQAGPAISINILQTLGVDGKIALIPGTEVFHKQLT